MSFSRWEPCNVTVTPNSCAGFVIQSVETNNGREATYATCRRQECYNNASQYCWCIHVSCTIETTEYTDHYIFWKWLSINLLLGVRPGIIASILTRLFFLFTMYSTLCRQQATDCNMLSTSVMNGEPIKLPLLQTSQRLLHVRTSSSLPQAPKWSS